LRAILVAILVLIGAPALAASDARPKPKQSFRERSLSERSSPAKASAPPMAFYVVKGAADSCGQGCDSWIAAEGQIDAGAASRFRKLLRQLGDRHPPIYFYSPGGNLEQALAMGAMLREKPVIARVGRTVVTECGFEAQDSEVCIRLKQSGRELHGDLWTRGAMCNSACPYLILGAANREIAPDAMLAVHSPRVVVNFRGGEPTQEMRAKAVERGLERADRLISSYIQKMGAEPGLLVLARSIKFEDMHILTREEIARFGIDRREVAETPWKFENSARGVIGKVVAQMDGGDKSYRMSIWRLMCFNSDQFELAFQRKTAANGILPTVSMSNGGARPLFFSLGRSTSPSSEIWGVRLDRASVRSLAGLAQLEFTETSQAPAGQRVAHSVKFSSEGLVVALDHLVATCPPPKSLATPFPAAPSPATPSVATPSVTTPLASRDSAAK
jgi:hypothetical protein